MFTLTTEEYTQGCDDYQGICLTCGEIKDSVEPDAEGYKCECCGVFAVKGLEQALICGEIEVEDDG